MVLARGLTTALLFGLFGRPFTRGKAPPGKLQYVACKHYPRCASPPEPATRENLVNPPFCKTHDMPMKAKWYGDPS